MDSTEAQLGWIMGCLPLFGLVIGWPSITTAVALLREERVLGRLDWYLRTALDRLRSVADAPDKLSISSCYLHALSYPQVECSVGQVHEYGVSHG
jgi:hypothetical protein